MTARARKYQSDKPNYEAVKAYRTDNNIKRVPLDMPLAEYESIKASAHAAGQPVNAYIKQAVRERQERDGTI